MIGDNLVIKIIKKSASCCSGLLQRKLPKQRLLSHTFSGLLRKTYTMVSKGVLNLIGCFLLMFLSISALNHGVLGARFLTEKLEDDEGETAQTTWKYQNLDNGSGTDGFFATIDRQVPSCPDPLHNK
ncbi:hypothetical protein GQ457_06G020680 [Hibiscus cannabinus]